MAIIPSLHASLFIVTRTLQTGFHVMPEGKNLTLQKNSTKIRLDEKMTHKSGEGFILTTKFYKSGNDAAILAPGSGTRKGRHLYRWKGRTPRNKIIQPSNKSRRGELTPTNFTLILAIPDKTGCARP